MRPRRVVFALNSREYRGAEYHVELAVGALAAQGYEPVVVCPDDPGLAILTAHLDEIGVRCVAYAIGGGGVRRQLAGAWRLGRLIRSLDADLLHVHVGGGDVGRGARLLLLAGMVARIPTVVTHHLPPARRLTACEWISSGPLLLSARRIIAVSEANRRLRITGSRLPAGRVVCVHNGVPVPSALDRAAARARLLDALGTDAGLGKPMGRSAQTAGPSTSGGPTNPGRCNATRLIGMVGSLTEQKGHHWLVEAAPAILTRCPGAEFVFIGDGPLRGSLTDAVTTAGLAGRFHFLGFRADARLLTGGLDVLAMPSEQEGLPLALLEAMALAVPVVANAVDGIPEAVTDGVEGFLVGRGDVVGLADRIGRVVGDDSEARRLGDAGRVRVLRDFSVEAMAVRLAQVYDAVLLRR